MEGRPAPAPRQRGAQGRHTRTWTHGTTTTHRTAAGPAARLRGGGPGDAARRLLLGRRLGLRQVRRQYGGQRYADDPGARPREVRHAPRGLRHGRQVDGGRTGAEGEVGGGHPGDVPGHLGAGGLLVDGQRLRRLPVPLAVGDLAALHLDTDRVGRAAGQGPVRRPGRAAGQGAGRDDRGGGQARRPGEFGRGEGHGLEGDLAERHGRGAGRQRRGDRRVQRRRAGGQEEPVGGDRGLRCGAGGEGRGPGRRRRQQLTARRLPGGGPAAPARPRAAAAANT
ncbi:hypothetical protein SBRY_10029 [Actinacidiphila bryophytorum]|uniref:Uncharacterized protein n=1 Tax=Actinacidiphila bryophytorum TaxID=1436133 RepID=A0A9W4E5K3_9ACTN|nr:hypothetical protein SBRY_10029 [Actinacidiphila bryophytorum]